MYFSWGSAISLGAMQKLFLHCLLALHGGLTIINALVFLTQYYCEIHQHPRPGTQPEF